MCTAKEVNDLTNFQKYIDPIILSRITYIDEKGKRRVKNPYRNRHSYAIIIPDVNDDGNFVWTVPEDIVGKSVFVEFPNQILYRFIVSANTNEVTVIGIPVSTYIEIHVVNPKPLPKSDKDLYWDELDYDAQKSIIAAWGDIDLICNTLYPSTAESELNFDDQNTLKYGLVGFRNNCGNLRNATHGYVDIPTNGLYNPPQPVPQPPSPPPVDPNISHNYDLKFILRWQDNIGTDLDMHAYLNHLFSNRVWYGEKEYGSENDKMWLDFDYTIHGDTGRKDQPEIITVLGFKSSILSIQIINFNGKSITEDVTLDVVDIKQSILKSYTIPAYALTGRQNYWVCDVNLATKSVIDKMKNIPSIGTFN
ncbi:hypothetical protein [Brevibacillus laterosporus]|uniref:hypothetical protein n=1 Tax=Brevibacillus laterosporus TaxID=1465 RepID=UPI003D2241E9